MRRLSSIAMVAGFLCAQGACLASVTYIFEDRTRSVYAYERTGMGSWEWIWAPDLGPFDVDFTSTVAEFSFAQHSRLDPTAITFDGAVMGGAGGHSGGYWSMITSWSRIDVLFEVDVATPFDVMVSATGDGNWLLESSLRTDLGDVEIFGGSGVANGILQPGLYRFQANIEATGLWWLDPDSGWEMSAPSHGNIHAVLNIPAPMAAPVVGLMMLAGRRRR
jgi:hypothetical protein